MPTLVSVCGCAGPSAASLPARSRRNSGSASADASGGPAVLLNAGDPGTLGGVSASINPNATLQHGASAPTQTGSYLADVWVEFRLEPPLCGGGLQEILIHMGLAEDAEFAGGATHRYLRETSIRLKNQRKQVLRHRLPHEPLECASRKSHSSVAQGSVNKLPLTFP